MIIEATLATAALAGSATSAESTQQAIRTPEARQSQPILPSFDGNSSGDGQSDGSGFPPAGGGGGGG